MSRDGYMFLILSVGVVGIEAGFRSHWVFFWFSEIWTSVLSHGWIHVVSKVVSLKDRLIAHRLGELMISQRMFT